VNCPNCQTELESARGSVLKKMPGLGEDFGELPQIIYLCHNCKGAWSQEGSEEEQPLKEIRRPQRPTPKKPLPQRA